MSFARIQDVHKNRLGCAVTATLVGDGTTTTVSVDAFVVRFDEDGGRFVHQPTGDIYDYASADHDLETITLSAGLPIGKTLTADDGLYVVDVDGNRVDDYYTNMAIDDVPTDVVPARVPQELRNQLKEGNRELEKGDPVRGEAGDEEWQVQELVGGQGDLDTGAFYSGDIKATGRAVAGGGTLVDGGWLKCDGTAVGRTRYAALFNAIGTTFGNGNGSTTFNLPDLRGRTIFGTGSTVTLGQNDGRVETNRGPGHEHAITQTTADVATNTQTTPGGANRVTGGGASPYVHDHTGTTGSGLGATNALGYMGINYLVKI